MPFFAASEAPPRPESMKFPVFSLLAGNLAFSETSSQLTPPSSKESANFRFRGVGIAALQGRASHLPAHSIWALQKGAAMEFEHSDKVRKLQERVEAFM